MLRYSWLLFATALAIRGQDTRHVVEPSIPASCAVLQAKLSSTRNPSSIAEADENKPDTVRIQRAIDACTPGQAVVLQPDNSHDAFLSGPLQLRKGVALVIGRGAILFGSRSPRDYDVTPGACGVVDQNGRGCKPLIAGDRADDAGVMGDGVIDGRGWAKLTGRNVSWWDLAQEAKVKNANQNCPRIMQLTRCNNFTLYRITLKNPGNFHVMYSQGDGFTAWGVVIKTPKSARNTDGIDPSSATNVTIAHCSIDAGDDNVAIKAGSSGPSSHITVAHNRFYSGHGMSIGSETNGGVSAIRVTDLSIEGADNGLRIKSNSSRGGLVRDVVYEDVRINNTKNPIMMDSNYTFYRNTRALPPTFTGIVLRNVHVSGGGKLLLEGLDAAHRLDIAFDGVVFDSPPSLIRARHANITFGPGPVNFNVSGEDVHVKRAH